MALTLAVVSQVGNHTVFTGGVGVGNGDIVVQTGDISRYDEFQVSSTSGSVEVIGSNDGVNYHSVASSLEDLSSITPALVANTTPNQPYGLYGPYAKLRVRQVGATAAVDVCLRCSKKGGER